MKRYRTRKEISVTLNKYQEDFCSETVTLTKSDRMLSIIKTLINLTEAILQLKSLNKSEEKEERCRLKLKASFGYCYAQISKTIFELSRLKLSDFLSALPHYGSGRMFDAGKVEMTILSIANTLIEASMLDYDMEEEILNLTTDLTVSLMTFSGYEFPGTTIIEFIELYLKAYA